MLAMLRPVLNAFTDNFELEFREWYLLYPRKVAPETAKRAYKLARKRGATREQLLAGVRNYIKECETREKRYIAHPATWLNGSRWEDENSAAESFAEPWHQRMKMWKDSGIWLPMWGPKPGQPDCRVPASLL